MMVLVLVIMSSILHKINARNVDRMFDKVWWFSLRTIRKLDLVFQITLHIIQIHL